MENMYTNEQMPGGTTEKISFFILIGHLDYFFVVNCLFKSFVHFLTTSSFTIVVFLSFI